MAEIQAPVPAAPMSSPAGPSSAAAKDALIARLDALLETYLHTLDEYEKLMQQLSSQLSSGFFALTQANFHNRSSVHYGQDRYDERVQAARRILVTETADSQFEFKTTSTLPNPQSGAEKDNYPTEQELKETEKETGKEKEKEKEVEEDEQTPPSNPSNNQDQPDKTSTDNPSPTPQPTDPIRMFGILVPPALRTAQSSFTSAVDGPVVRLVGVKQELRALEREVGRARKGIRRLSG